MQLITHQLWGNWSVSCAMLRLLRLFRVQFRSMLNGIIECLQVYLVAT